MPIFIHSLDTRFRSTHGWRAIGIGLCGWVSGVIALAGWAAYEDGVELYRWTMLLLLLAGGPIMLAAVAYAGVLFGRRGRKWLAVSVVLAVVFAIALNMAVRKEEVPYSAVPQPVVPLSPEVVAQCKKECLDDSDKYCRLACEMQARESTATR